MAGDYVGDYFNHVGVDWGNPIVFFDSQHRAAKYSASEAAFPCGYIDGNISHFSNSNSSPINV